MLQARRVARFCFWQNNWPRPPTEGFRWRRARRAFSDINERGVQVCLARKIRRIVISSEARTEKSVGPAPAEVLICLRLCGGFSLRYRAGARFLGSCLTRNDKPQLLKLAHYINQSYGAWATTTGALKSPVSVRNGLAGKPDALTKLTAGLLAHA